MSNKVAISYFKAHCLEIIDDIQRKHSAVIITKRNNAVAKIVPIDDQEQRQSILGSFENRGKIKKDIIHPIEEEWEA